ncbi:exo-rhamnogalacturonan lyase family protein [Nocardioides bruguierae]|uniref:exo-rhamnogalacturonan lyase family protein n=1 Tax=Nocardioides bruguierae TaxID=2945102 RepID=UPI002022487D|nr:Tat pathway signal sequence domain protein [Nocardioides bruguierae]MCL8026811.1 Tat pathway signal sequence domain protein [Nocardioides bruguierae]
MNHPLQPSRRAVLGGFVAAAATAAVAGPLRPTAASAAGVLPLAGVGPDGQVPLRWLDGVPTTHAGSTFGLPWPRGARSADAPLSLRSGDGEVPLQSWTLATWPDGSVKWSGHAVAAGAALADDLEVVDGQPVAPARPATVRRSGDRVVLGSGVATVTLAGSGTTPLREVTRSGRACAREGRLVLTIDDAPAGSPASTQDWVGVVTDLVVEQEGPVRAVARLSGHHEPVRGASAGSGGAGRPRLLPWTMRVAVTAGSDVVEVEHSFVHDADPATQLVSGLGLQVVVPLDDAPHDTHLRFAGEDRGVWGEPVRVLTGLRREPGAAVDEAQFAGTATPPVSQWAAQVAAGYEDLPLWEEFSLRQHSADSFTVRKRTGADYRWLENAGWGRRAAGLGYVGGPSGGLGFGVQDFWQAFPRALDVTGAAGDAATVTLWAWSPHGEAMDMRGYAAAGHGLGLAYEDPREGFGDPVGIARSTRFELHALDATPSRPDFADRAEALQARAQLVSTPAVYHRAGVFGHWSLPDRSTARRTALEDAMVDTVDFYAGQVEERHWYGFWDHGDVMHTYDADRHEWRYDVGGFAWDNGELGTDGSLWYQFLRTGDAGTFRLAERMTRHISESDSYHSGPFAGLGSRHNVLHYGDGAKEARVNESYTKRFWHYVTASALAGDYLEATLQVDETVLVNPPLRDYYEPPAGVPTALRLGPDWYALVSNWLAAWERTGEDRWRRKIVTGMRDVAALPAGLFTGQLGGAVGFDPETGHITKLDTADFTGGYNLAMAFLGDQVMFELVDLVDVPEFRRTLLEFATYVQSSSAEKTAHFGRDFNPQVFKTIYSRVTAWAGVESDDAELRRRGWETYLADPAGEPWAATAQVSGPDSLGEVTEVPGVDIATNDASQRALAVIALLALAPDEAP